MTGHDRALAMQAKRFSVGVDLGGTNLRVGTYAGGSDLLQLVTMPARISDGPTQVVHDMAGAIRGLMRMELDGLPFAGVGIGMPGPLELPEGILRNPPNLAGWDGFNLRQAIEEALGFQVAFESDANVAALAEFRLGSGKIHQVDSVCVLTLGTGVGSGLILNGKIWHGSTGMGGEAGHIVVDSLTDDKCGCGGSGCLEQFASASAVMRMATERFGSRAPQTARELAQWARQGDAEARSIFEFVGEALAIGLAGLINTLNLPLYLLGGGVSDAWDLFAPAMFAVLPQRSYVYRLTAPAELDPAVLEHHKTYIMKAHLGSNAGILGAALLALEADAPRGAILEETVVNQ